MSHLRAPATRADRREGGRHGRPVARPAPALPETLIRPQLMRLAVLPPLAVALSATAAVLFSVRSMGAHTGPTLWAVLAGAVTVAVAGILIAAVAADRAARSVTDRVAALRRTAARGEADLHTLVDALRQGEPPPQRTTRRRPPEEADDFELLAADLARAHDGAVTAVVRAAQLSSQTSSEQKLEVFVNLARRLQSLVHREISILDDLENEIEDPDLLKGLFHVDHLATRIRRHAENLAVLGGAVSRRQWSNPVNMTEVLRSAIAEVEQYSRVKLVPPIDGELRGHAVADVIHLLAELIENATVFSAPQTQVLLRANLVTSGLAVEVEDRGLGMPVGEQDRMNALLTDPDQVNVASLLADGRIGLYVVSQLARRHGITVRLQTNIYGGVQAVLVVPEALLGTATVVSGAPVEAGAAQPRNPADTGATRQPLRVPAPVSPGGRTPDGQLPAGVPAQADLGTGFPAGSATAPQPTVAPGCEPGLGAQVAPGSDPGPGSQVTTGTGAGPGTGRRRHAQRGSGRRNSDTGAARRGAEGGDGGRNGAALAPLPVRGAQDARPTPAEAVPGISAEDRPAVEAHAGILPGPRVGSVRGTMDKPQLPRRRAQEHIVPQLRGGPAPRQDSDTVAGHDPGLVAAFQRGIGLAEAQQHLESAGGEPLGGEAPGREPVYGEPAFGEPAFGESTYGEPTGTRSAYGQPAYQDAQHTGSARTDAAHMDSAHIHTDAAHTDAVHAGSPHAEAARMGSAQTGSPRPEAAHADPVHTGSPHADAVHTRSAHTDPAHMGSNHMASAPIPQARDHAPVSDGTRGDGRSDGSAPAG
jgi:signal transduction histidine kinase